MRFCAGCAAEVVTSRIPQLSQSFNFTEDYLSNNGARFGLLEKSVVGRTPNVPAFQPFQSYQPRPYGTVAKPRSPCTPQVAAHRETQGAVANEGDEEELEEK